ncbi:hypothetical protein CSOJ01_08339 [Colletotrichum sojae]|uniref:Uncharacterized protein n=1 Tax=Colletotrichum sojae TaxID=2175907 RepID=A0A8H6J741_9PEZI|nr:hypothetical protein CSOJ01_08339 [Colletotrichum sojae]
MHALGSYNSRRHCSPFPHTSEILLRKAGSPGLVRDDTHRRRSGSAAPELRVGAKECQAWGPIPGKSTGPPDIAAV